MKKVVPQNARAFWQAAASLRREWYMAGALSPHPSVQPASLPRPLRSIRIHRPKANRRQADPRYQAMPRPRSSGRLRWRARQSGLEKGRHMPGEEHQATRQHRSCCPAHSPLFPPAVGSRPDFQQPLDPRHEFSPRERLPECIVRPKQHRHFEVPAVVPRHGEHLDPGYLLSQ